MPSNIDTALSPGSAGGCPRPSLMGHRWQGRALESGPSPSEASVVAGDDTHSRWNSPLPTRKSSSSSKLMVDRWLQDGVVGDPRAHGRGAARTPLVGDGGGQVLGSGGDRGDGNRLLGRVRDQRQMRIAQPRPRRPAASLPACARINAGTAKLAVANAAAWDDRIIVAPWPAGPPRRGCGARPPPPCRWAWLLERRRGVVDAVGALAIACRGPAPRPPVRSIGSARSGR